MFIFPTPVTLYKRIPDLNNSGRFLKDDYGKYIFEPQEIKVALSLRENVVKDRDGVERKSFMDVDFPKDILFDFGDELEYKDEFNRSFRGTIFTIEENTDPLGIRVLSRFASIGYQ